MTLSQKIAAAVESLPTAGLTPPCVVEAEVGSHRLTLDLTAAGPVGLAFTRLAFASSSEADLSSKDLRAWGDRLAARITYLMEPLVVLEVDPLAGEAELRSRTPTPRGELRSFYEVRLGCRGRLQLLRIGFDDATRRRAAVPCQMTLEVLERLADDLAASRLKAGPGAFRNGATLPDFGRAALFFRTEAAS